MTARPLGARVWTGATFDVTLDRNYKSGTPFRPLIRSDASHRSSLGTRPVEFRPSFAESTLKATAIQLVKKNQCPGLMSRSPNIKIRVFFQTLKSAALLGNGSNLVPWRARLSTRSLSIFSSTTKSPSSPLSSSGQSPSSGSGSGGPTRLMKPDVCGSTCCLGKRDF